MSDVSVTGIDLAKSVFHVVGMNKSGKVRYAKKVSRGKLLEFMAQSPRSLVGMEACGGSHYWSREIEKLGHEVKLMPPQYVKPYVKRNKNDMNDASAIAEAVTRESMHFVPTKSESQQSLQMVHRVRERLVKNRTALINEIRGFLLEFGVVIPQGRTKFRQVLGELLGNSSLEVDILALRLINELYIEYINLEEKVNEYDNKIKAVSKSHPQCRRLETIPGIGPLTSTALVAGITDVNNFKNGRQLAAWLGLTPRQHSTGGKTRLQGISKRGDSYIRKLLIHGARACLRCAHKRQDRRSRWVVEVAQRRGNNVASVALANKMARTVWALLSKQEDYRCFPRTLDNGANVILT